MRLFDNGKLLPHLLDTDVVRPVLGEQAVNLCVVFLYRSDERGLRVAVPALLIPFERLRAVGGQLFLTCGQCLAVSTCLGSSSLLKYFQSMCAIVPLSVPLVPWIL